MTISNKVLDKVFDRFKGDDPYSRLELTEPSIEKDFLACTNGHFLICVPTEMAEDISKYKKVDQYPDVAGLLKAQNKLKHRRVFKVADVMNILNQIPKEPVYEDCKSCDGFGDIECVLCSHSHECEECGGTGHSDKQIGEMLRKYRDQISLHDKWFSPQYMYDIFLSYQEMGIEEVELQSEMGYSAMFNGSNVLTLIMARMESFPDANIISIDELALKAGIPVI